MKNSLILYQTYINSHLFPMGVDRNYRMSVTVLKVKLAPRPHSYNHAGCEYYTLDLPEKCLVCPSRASPPNIANPNEAS